MYTHTLYLACLVNRSQKSWAENYIHVDGTHSMGANVLKGHPVMHQHNLISHCSFSDSESAADQKMIPVDASKLCSLRNSLTYTHQSKPLHLLDSWQFYILLISLVIPYSVLHRLAVPVCSLEHVQSPT
jgi:hypothetical protein